MNGRPLVRAASALAAALALPALLAAPASAAVSPPACADTVVDATWTTGYAGGRYELATVTLDGLGACAGSEIQVGLASPDRIATIDAVVLTDDLVLDVAGLGLPAAALDRIALTLLASPPVDAPGEVGSAVQAGPAATPSAGVAAPAATTADAGALPSTGVAAAWLAPAAALVLLGVLLRRRARRAAADV